MFGHVLQQKINRDFQTDLSKRVKSKQKTSDHCIVSKEILKPESLPIIFQLIGVTDRYIFITMFYQNDMAGEPDFCRDIIETNIKGILHTGAIPRDITLLQVGLKFYTISLANK